MRVTIAAVSAFFMSVRPAAVVETILFDELVRIGVPVLAPRLDHIEMSDDEHGLTLAGAVQAHHEILRAIRRAQNVNVALRKTGITKALRDG